MIFVMIFFGAIALIAVLYHQVVVHHEDVTLWQLIIYAWGCILFGPTASVLVCVFIACSWQGPVVLRGRKKQEVLS